MLAAELGPEAAALALEEAAQAIRHPGPVGRG